MGKGHRQGRLGEEIRRIISDLLLSELKDLQAKIRNGERFCRRGNLRRQLRYRIYHGFGFGFKARGQRKNSGRCAGSTRAAPEGVIKREIGRQIKLRHIPDLIFKMDTSLEYGRHIEEIIQGLDKS